jgi:hypothetical protein
MVDGSGTSVPLRESPAGRVADALIASVVVGLAVASVWFLARVPPDPRGYGTHELFGMTPCGWPERYGIPCPTCGVTTAAAWLVHLSPWRAVATQPFGAVVAALGLWLAFVALVCLVRRRSFVAWLARLPYGTLLGLGIVLMLVAWLYKYLTWG